jgi:hypothetical protein
LNHRKCGSKRQAAVMQLLSFAVPPRDRLPRQGRDVTRRCECGQCDAVDHWLEGCERHPIEDYPEGLTSVDTRSIAKALAYEKPPERTGYPDTDQPICKIGASEAELQRRKEEEIFPDGSAKHNQRPDTAVASAAAVHTPGDGAPVLTDLRPSPAHGQVCCCKRTCGSGAHGHIRTWTAVPRGTGLPGFCNWSKEDLAAAIKSQISHGGITATSRRCF